MTHSVFDRSSKPLPTKEALQQIEFHAMQIRRNVGINLTDKFDVFALATALNLQIAFPQDVHGLDQSFIAELSNMSAMVWSGMADKLPNGQLFVVLNPNQTRQRMHVTVLEEVAHDYFGHVPTKIFIDQFGVHRREYEEHKEKEAYWTAAAVLLPSKVIARSVWHGASAEDIANIYDTSKELVEMRVKLFGLWPEYLSRLRKSAA